MRTNHSDGIGKSGKQTTADGNNGQLYESNNSRGSKKDAYMNSSMNLDELKVSDDDVSSRSSWFFCVEIFIVLQFVYFEVF